MLAEDGISSFDEFDSTRSLSSMGSFGGCSYMTSSVTLTASESKAGRDERVPITKPIDFRRYLGEHFEIGMRPDMEICIDDQVIECRRSILNLYSKYIRKLKSGEKRIELPSQHVTPDAMVLIYDWMFSQNCKLQRDSILEVHAAAKFLEIDYLVDQSWHCMISPIVYEDRAFMLYLEALFFGLPAVQDLMISRVQKFFLTLVGFKQFLELPFVHVCEMLSSDLLGVNSELEVFYACVLYLTSDWEDRKDRVYEMLKHVRFGLLPPHVLVSFRYKKETPEINRMLENPYVEKLLSETMHFSIGLGTPPVNSLLYKEREWIYDTDCDYHYTKNLPGRHRLTYDRFLDYVHNLAKSETAWLNYESLDDVEHAVKYLGLK